MKIVQILSADCWVMWRPSEGKLERRRLAALALTDDGNMTQLEFNEQGGLDIAAPGYVRHVDDGPPPAEWCEQHRVPDPDLERRERAAKAAAISLDRDIEAVVERVRTTTSPMSKTFVAENMPGWGKPRGYAAVHRALDLGLILERQIIRSESGRPRKRLCVFTPDSPWLPLDEPQNESVAPDANPSEPEQIEMDLFERIAAMQPAHVSEQGDPPDRS